MFTPLARGFLVCLELGQGLMVKVRQIHICSTTEIMDQLYPAYYYLPQGEIAYTEVCLNPIEDSSNELNLFILFKGTNS